jgi:hypothetical protein
MAEAPGTHNPHFLPPDIPVPQDDGAARHLADAKLPDLALPATSGPAVNLSKLKGRTVLYIYPRTGVAGVDSPPRWGQKPRVRVSRSLCRAQGARRHSSLWSVDARHRLSARGGGAPAFAVRYSVRCGFEFCAEIAPADVHGVRHDAAQAHGARHRRRGDREGVLSGVSAGQECRRSHCLAAQPPSAARGTFWSLNHARRP